MTQPICDDDNPEAQAGDPVPDPWDEEVDDGELDPGAVPGQPA